jgi:hypothetical protein
MNTELNKTLKKKNWEWAKELIWSNAFSTESQETLLCLSCLIQLKLEKAIFRQQRPALRPGENG